LSILCKYKIKQLACGMYYSMAVTYDGILLCWGKLNGLPRILELSYTPSIFEPLAHEQVIEVFPCLLTIFVKTTNQWYVLGDGNEKCKVVQWDDIGPPSKIVGGNRKHYSLHLNRDETTGTLCSLFPTTVEMDQVIDVAHGMRCIFVVKTDGSLMVQGYFCQYYREFTRIQTDYSIRRVFSTFAGDYMFIAQDEQGQLLKIIAGSISPLQFITKVEAVIAATYIVLKPNHMISKEQFHFIMNCTKLQDVEINWLMELE
jgi:alpha-tubulin suppressor-like RCC1 family protein